MKVSSIKPWIAFLIIGAIGYAAYAYMAKKKKEENPEEVAEEKTATEPSSEAEAQELRGMAYTAIRLK